MTVRVKGFWCPIASPKTQLNSYQSLEHGCVWTSKLNEGRVSGRAAGRESAQPLHSLTGNESFMGFHYSVPDNSITVRASRGISLLEKNVK